MRIQNSFRRSTAPVVSLATVTILAAGCQLWVNPFKDDLACQREVTTSSVTAARAVPVEAVATQRPYGSTHVHAKSGAVTHGPLYFEDPFEDTGSEDGRFAWSGADHLYSWLYGPGRFLVNTVSFPISVVVAPPWVVMASDGRPGRSVAGMRHDAQAWAEQDGAAPRVR